MPTPTIFLNLILVLNVSVFAQLSPLQQQFDWVMPHTSPAASVSIKLGVTDMQIDYHRPLVKGREVWGKLVPYGQVWRAGANKTTNITFGTEVLIEGQKLPAGTYGFFIIPTENDWEIIFSKGSERWGAFSYKPTEDVLRIKVKPQNAEHQEALAYTIDATSQDNCEIIFHWEKKKARFTVKVDTIGLTKKKADSTFNWQSAYFAVIYFLEEKRDLDEALKWSNVALSLQESYSTYFLKARVLAEMGRYKDAIQTAEKALEIAKTITRTPVPSGQITLVEKLIADWRLKQ